MVIANSRGAEPLEALARETCTKPVQASKAPRGEDLVVVTIPEDKVPQLPRGLFKNAPLNLIVVDTGNYYPRERGWKNRGHGMSRCMRRKELESLRSRIGFVFQGGALFDSMTVYDNVAFPLREQTSLGEKEIRRKVAEELSWSVWRC